MTFGSTAMVSLLIGSYDGVSLTFGSTARVSLLRLAGPIKKLSLAMLPKVRVNLTVLPIIKLTIL